MTWTLASPRSHQTSIDHRVPSIIPAHHSSPEPLCLSKRFHRSPYRSPRLPLCLVCPTTPASGHSHLTLLDMFQHYSRSTKSLIFQRTQTLRRAESQPTCCQERFTAPATKAEHQPNPKRCACDEICTSCCKKPTSNNQTRGFPSACHEK